MQKLRTVVAGLGRIGWQFHLPEIDAHEEFELVGVVDPLEERRHEALARYGAPGYPELQAALDAPAPPGLLVIASPTPFHCPQALAAFEQGWDVFCDKPIALDLEVADRMIEAARRHGRKLMVYQPKRATREMVALRDIIGQDLIGRVYMIRHAMSNFSRRNDWQAFTKHGGGMLNNYGAHAIDVLLYLAESRARKVSCALRRVVSAGDADDLVKAVIETDDHTILDIDINQATALPIPPWQVFGERGTIVFDSDKAAWHVCHVPEDELPSLALQTGMAANGRVYGSGEHIPWQDVDIPVADYEPVDFYARCYEYFALDAEPFVPVEDTREVMRVIAACRQDSATNP